jgi:nucleoside-diphosphate-sugar epimerase
MSIVIALTGASGAMGGEALAHLLASPLDLKIRVFEWEKDPKRTSFYKKTLRKGKGQIVLVRGDLGRYDDCVKFIDGADYVLHLAALIPPRSDHSPKGAYESDFLATKNLVDAINANSRRESIKFVNIGTVAEYGNRNLKTLWGRVGDPIISSDYDDYSMNKIRAERYLLDHKPPHFVSLRQTAIAHKYLFQNNMGDGLMFHTVWNGVLEWVSDRDSGLLIEHLVEEDQAGALNDFWDRIFNIGGGLSCRVSGYESISEGFELMGKTAKKFFEPNYNAARNFHGVFYFDSGLLEAKLHFRNDSLRAFWKRMGRHYWYFSLAKICPSFLIKDFAIKPLLKNDNAPMYWVKHGMKGRVKAFYGGEEAFQAIPKSWKDYPLLCENKKADGSFVDFSLLKDPTYAKAHGYWLDHGYDETKPWSELTLDDVKKAAEFRGGQCLATSMRKGDLWTKLPFVCAEGHPFEMAPFTLLIGGYWCPVCEQPTPWATGKMARKSPFFAQVYLADHAVSEEDDVYPLSEGSFD